MSKLRLFMLRQGKGGKPVTDSDGNVIFYPDKPLAKQARVGGQVVSKGVDHKRYIDRGELV